MRKYSLLGETMIRNAEVFATAAHAAIDQRRKYSGEPYIVHPRAVAGIVQACSSHTWQQVVLAWIHDTVEDTKITDAVVRDMFGEQIADDLTFLTDVERSAGSRAYRHGLNNERLLRAPNRVKTVKAADIFQNIHRIVEYDPAFAVTFLAEKESTMLVLRGADDILWELTFAAIQKQKEYLQRVQERERQVS